MLFDTHAHLDQEDFDADRDEVVARAAAAGVETIVAVGYDRTSSERAVAIAGRYESVFASVGIQPNSVVQALPGDWDQVLELVKAPRVVALGETGLDKYWDNSPLELQQDYFDRHLRLSQSTGLPFIVHTRESDAEVLAMLEEAARRGPLSGVMHSFTGTAETAAACVELGMHVSFAGMVTFKKSQDLQAVATAIPAERILVETDSPYLSPHPLRGRRNEPAHVVHTAAFVAQLRGQTLEEFAAQTTSNARRLFKLPAK